MCTKGVFVFSVKEKRYRTKVKGETWKLTFISDTTIASNFGLGSDRVDLSEATRNCGALKFEYFGPPAVRVSEENSSFPNRPNALTGPIRAHRVLRGNLTSTSGFFFRSPFERQHRAHTQCCKFVIVFCFWF